MAGEADSAAKDDLQLDCRPPSSRMFGGNTGCSGARFDKVSKSNCARAASSRARRGENPEERSNPHGLRRLMAERMQPTWAAPPAVQRQITALGKGVCRARSKSLNM